MNLRGWVLYGYFRGLLWYGCLVFVVYWFGVVCGLGFGVCGGVSLFVSLNLGGYFSLGVAFC